MNLINKFVNLCSCFKTNNIESLVATIQLINSEVIDLEFSSEP